MEEKEKIQREVILAYLERERETWLGLLCMCQEEPCETNFEEARESYFRIDSLLDDYNQGE